MHFKAGLGNSYLTSFGICYNNIKVAEKWKNHHHRSQTLFSWVKILRIMSLLLISALLVSNCKILIFVRKYVPPVM